jgi:hypothetical protein
MMLLVIAILLMLVLWARNFWRADVVWAPLPRQGYAVVASYRGQMELAIRLQSLSSPAPVVPTTSRWGRGSYSVTWNSASEIVVPHAKPFRYRRLPYTKEVNIIVPYWFLIPASWVLAAGLWIRWSVRFSLRALMVAMALVSIALAIYVTSGW